MSQLRGFHLLKTSGLFQLVSRRTSFSYHTLSAIDFDPYACKPQIFAVLEKELKVFEFLLELVFNYCWFKLKNKANLKIAFVPSPLKVTIFVALCSKSI